ncbi:MAG: alpha/beta hydrolase [Lachnospiraceae bacterium]|nr:alpha/beta hydrolase [Lachnospiraceae bacterium]MBO5146914.1 alpha/beta hydrolase [Lachnospiraceae bacterium]
MSNGRIMLKYKQTGNSSSETTLIFLHGSTMTKESMLPVAEGFPQYNCIVFDLTAHGESEGEEPYEVAGFLEDLEYSVEQLQQAGVAGEKVVLLGYSMGGAITCEAALRKKLKLAGIVLMGSGADLSSHTPLVDGLKGLPASEFKTAALYSCLFGTDTPEEDQRAITELFASTKTAEEETGYGDLMASNRYNRLADCGAIDIPVLMVQGNDDRVVLPAAAVETWKAIPGSELLMIPYKGHAAIFEDKELVRDKVQSFVEKL